MTIKIGDHLPAATFAITTAEGRKSITTDELFKAKKVVLFAVPGAYTPTCDAKHLPGYLELADKLHAKGVDTIACVSVNDVFVMNAWAKHSNVGDKVVMLADGNADFARAVGLALDGRAFGMGERSQRYALYAEDGVVKQLFVEAGGEFKVSSAEHMLAAL